MQLPLNFEFSQSSLQDYTDCRRRFFLRYIQRVSWPAVQTEPVIENERHIRRGERFHRLVQQYLLGVPVERLAEIANADPDEHLPQWWQSFISSVASGLNGTRSVELALVAPLANTRLAARYDLILTSPEGHLIIYDWKTSLKRPKRNWLASRLQTQVYPYLLARAGNFLLQKNTSQSPEQISMIYWFAEFPNQPERFNYNKAQYAEDGRTLENLVTDIVSSTEHDFILTPHIERCAFCVYRSLCDRGVSAGQFADNEAEPESITPDVNLDLDQTAEISF
jgi:PD-(D/E)XK nuclease superfamily